MIVKALIPLNHQDRTIKIGEIIELEDEGAAKQLIQVKAVEEVKESTTNKNIGESKC